MDIITLTTDFGLTEYPAAMKGVILAINQKARIIDITHSILSQNILQGAFMLYSVVDYFPKAIHIGVVDPGVGTARAGLIFACKKGVLIGPDNGLLVPAAERLGIKLVVKITNFGYCLEEISDTFHGRDIFAPIAAYISKGISIENLGETVNKYVQLNLFDIQDDKQQITGKVLNIDNFGNIITNLPKQIIKKYFKIDEILNITQSSGQPPWKLPFKTTYGAVAKGKIMATISSSGLLELAGNQCSVNEKLNLNISDEIIIQK